ncbi:MAG TPA: hypothetical protein VJ731_16995 [Terriglobales bacterium]|nr:hypothetical protein [Terriglobales bacterium]
MRIGQQGFRAPAIQPVQQAVNLLVIRRTAQQDGITGSAASEYVEKLDSGATLGAPPDIHLHSRPLRTIPIRLHSVQQYDIGPHRTLPSSPTAAPKNLDLPGGTQGALTWRGMPKRSAEVGTPYVIYA